MVKTIRGLVRPLVAAAFVGTTAWLFLKGQLEAKDILPITGIVIGFYFGEKTADRRKSDA